MATVKFSLRGADSKTFRHYAAEIETDNDAFRNGNRNREICRIVGEARIKLRCDVHPSQIVLRDLNGNRVGTVTELSQREIDDAAAR